MTMLMCWLPAGLISRDPARLERDETRQREGRWMTFWEGAGVMLFVLPAGCSLRTLTDAKWLLRGAVSGSRLGSSSQREAPSDTRLVPALPVSCTDLVWRLNTAWGQKR